MGEATSIATVTFGEIIMNGIAKTMLLGAATLVLISVVFTQSTLAHCQIPCGIYDDRARVASMLEDVATIHEAVLADPAVIGELHGNARHGLARDIRRSAEALVHDVNLTVGRIEAPADGIEGRGDGDLARPLHRRCTAGPRRLQERCT